MKNLIAILTVIGLTSCGLETEKITELQMRIDSLKTELANVYKPGFGEIMSGVQIHHSKLWFAGINENWKLADFEIHEINELLDDIKKYQGRREESKDIDMIKPALESMRKAIKKNSVRDFKTNYENLTKVCNDCHKITKFEYNIVKVPSQPVFDNQAFRVKK